METNYTFACVLLDEVFKLTVANAEHEELLRGIIELLLPGKRIRSLRFGDREQHGLAVSDKNTLNLISTVRKRWRPCFLPF